MGALILVSQGVVQHFRPYDTAKLVEPMRVQRVGADGKPVTTADNKPVMDTVTEQTIAQGPVASQEIIKEFGTNGGGFFNANSAHPFENPTPLTNLIEMLTIFAIGAGLTYTLGRMTGSQQHGWAIWSAMAPQMEMLPPGCPQKASFQADIEVAVFARPAETHAALLLPKRSSIVSTAAGLE